MHWARRLDSTREWAVWAKIRPIVTWKSEAIASSRPPSSSWIWILKAFNRVSGVRTEGAGAAEGGEAGGGWWWGDEEEGRGGGRSGRPWWWRSLWRCSWAPPSTSASGPASPATPPSPPTTARSSGAPLNPTHLPFLFTPRLVQIC